MHKISTRPYLYIVLLILWSTLIGFTMPAFIQSYVLGNIQSSWSKPILLPLIVLNTFFIGYFWLNGLKDIVYTATYYLKQKALLLPQGKDSPRKRDRVILLYCTFNDFSPESLRRCMEQDYPNCQTVILDDSDDKNYIKRVDDFAKYAGATVIRRNDRIGFKAGNINHYLMEKTDYDYFVLLDSDEIIPPDFVTKCLTYFRRYRNLGILQASHIATRNRNAFMRTLSRGVDSHWPVYQSVKYRYGFLSLLGHGAMVSRKCYQATNGFPHVVAEDLCFSLECRMHGYYTAFAKDIVCQEEYPVDYLAFKKRHSKWTQGNMEFIKKYSRRIMSSNLKWYEKLDIVLFTYSLPLTAVFALYVVINLIFFPLLSYSLPYPSWLLIPTIVFLMAPMMNDIIYYSTRLNPVKLLFYIVTSFLLYGSMFYVSLESSVKSLLGKKAYFLVTPKNSKKISLLEAVIGNYKEILFAIILIAISMAMMGNPLPVILIAVPSMLSPILTLYSNYGRNTKRLRRHRHHHHHSYIR